MSVSFSPPCLVLALLGLFWGGSFSGNEAHAQSVTPKAARPNFLIVLCDDLGYGDLECYGHPKIKTPNLNQFALDGIRLTACYSAAPVCSPSRVGLMTGRSPNRAGVYDWIPPANGKQSGRKDRRELVHMRDSEVTLPKLLKTVGYQTCMVGKWHCNSRFNSKHQPQPGDAGFDHWMATQNNAAPSHANPTNFVRNGTPVGPLKGYSCQLVVDEAIRWLEDHRQNQKQDPFFMYVAFHEPHEPVASPPELVEKHLKHAKNRKQAEYFANVENVDLAVGKLLKSLQRLDLDEQTLIVFTSDNGPETLNRYKRADRSWGTPGPLRGMKLWTTDAGFRVAGLMRWKGTIAAGQVIDAPVSSLDLLPTFCELAGVKLDQDRFDGVSLGKVPLSSAVVRERPLLWVYYNAINQRRAAMRHGNYKMLARLAGVGKSQNLHDGNRDQFLGAKLVDFQLFDVTQDVGEAKNLFDANEAESKKLKQLMEQEYARLVKESHVW